MKTIKLLLLCFVAVFLSSCCNESTQIMKYHFFSRTELDDIYMNTDSILNFQSKVSKYVTYEQFKGNPHTYSEIDTVLFISENGDTISCNYDNRIIIDDIPDGLGLGYHASTRTTIGIGLYSIDSCFISGAAFSMQKPSEFMQDSLSKHIGFWYPDYKKKGFDAQLLKYGENNPDNTYFIVSRETFSINSIQIANCLFVRFFDELSNQKALIVYSNKYGFLNLKDNQHEITRIL
ncbi:MAG: hypothetical protein WCL70_12445 [Paludibacter sp.]